MSKYTAQETRGGRNMVESMTLLLTHWFTHTLQVTHGLKNSVMGELRSALSLSLLSQHTHTHKLECEFY